MLGNVVASFKVSYDKLYDYIIPNIVDEVIIDDTMEQYHNIIKVENYRNEEIGNNNKRLLEHVGIYSEYSIFFGEPTHIIDNIYLGSAFNAASYETLKKHGIETIINMTREISNYYPDEFNYIQYELHDNNKNRIINYLESAYLDIVNNQEGNILIHCYMGASRSASIMIYYLMKKYDYTFDDALNFIKDKRIVVNPTFRLTKDLAQSMSN